MKKNLQGASEKVCSVAHFWKEQHDSSASHQENEQGEGKNGGDGGKRGSKLSDANTRALSGG